MGGLQEGKYMVVHGMPQPALSPKRPMFTSIVQNFLMMLFPIDDDVQLIPQVADKHWVESPSLASKSRLPSYYYEKEWDDSGLHDIILRHVMLGAEKNNNDCQE